MPISQTDQLFQLIKSLTKSEKRNFTLYARRIQSSDRSKFIRLFELLDKQKELDEKNLLSKLKGVDKSQFSNLKRHLYKQILVSLRLIHIHKDRGVVIREHIDFASVLYGKGLHVQSLKILDRAKKMAEKNGFEMLTLEILEHQKMIESKHITRSGIIKNDALVEETKNKIKQVSNTILLSNLRHKLHGLYLKNGHVRNEKDVKVIQRIFKEEMPFYEHDELGFFAKISLYQSHVWNFYIQLDFDHCSQYALKWVDLFKSSPNLIDWDHDLFMRGYHYLLTSAYNIRDINTFNKYLAELESYRKSNYSKFNTNSKIISFLYVHSSRLNKHFLLGTFDEGVKILKRTTRRISLYRSKLDAHRILVFYFKISWMYFCNGQPDISIDYLNKIINLKAQNLREDIQGYSYLLLAMAHFELGNFTIMDYLVRNAKNYYQKMKQVNLVQTYALDFFRTISTSPIEEHKNALEILKRKLEKLKDNRFERRAFLYLDIYSWTISKIEKKPMSQVIQAMNKKAKSL